MEKTTAEVKQEYEIDNEVISLRDSLGSLEQNTTELEMRLVSVTACKDEDKGAPITMPELCPLACELLECDVVVQNVNNRLLSILNRLQVK